MTVRAHDFEREIVHHSPRREQSLTRWRGQGCHWQRSPSPSTPLSAPARLSVDDVPECHFEPRLPQYSARIFYPSRRSEAIPHISWNGPAHPGGRLLRRCLDFARPAPIVDQSCSPSTVGG